MSPGRELAAAAALTAAGAGGMLAALAQVWARVSLDLPAPLEDAVVELEGSRLAGTAQALAWAGLAAVAALLATRGRWRRLVGGAAAALGAGAAAAVLAAAGEGPMLAAALEDHPTGRLDAVAAAPLWPWLAFAGALLLVAAGLATLLRGGAWPAMGSRYDHPGASGRTGPAGAAEAADDPARLWDALDHGVDPTRKPENLEQ
ncbi:Trp biosynthesis-associated membrane protein [Allonocardiopsis opalescens]|uniref:Putative membrane protein (TIGR02234 family) n=1 Tax=Allonocardiopsis opalescens TaxID=1144618 RepID=A0A2T0Q439_9ACTN|nr:Trp biosynthesis-associated membrane protein [Allonocardiopsis opalescens]PRX98523.1 putative membrane protein (TIGR02234 family) [Allonocardiopsis opalescens]